MSYASHPPIPSTRVDSHSHSLMNLSFATILLAIVLFVASLFLPVFITQTNDIYGYWVLGIGWLGFIAFQFAWYASPFAVLAVYIARKSPQFGLLLSVIAILMASEAFLFTEVPFGRNDKVLDYDLGFYLWYSCFYLVSLSILLRLIAWGKVEEDEPLVHQQQPLEEPLIDDESQVLPEIVKAKRKIITKQKKINKNKQIGDWGTQAPPALPKKNVYKEKGKNKENSNTLMDEALIMVSPPQLIKREVLVKDTIEPPPLPEVKKTAINPPPLPEKNLGIAPFLENK